MGTRVRDDLIVQAVDELRGFVSRHASAEPRRGTRLARQLDVAQRVVAAFDRETATHHRSAGADRRRVAA